MNITKTKKEIIIRIPRYTNRYDLVGDTGEVMDNLIGVIEHHRDNSNNYDEYGLCYRIDMGYKGKDDQWTGFVIKCLNIELEEFRRMCKDLEIDIVEF